MDRVTRRIGDTVDFVDGKGYSNLSHAESVRLLFNTLADYEDIGMTPDEIYKVIKQGVPEWVDKYLEYRKLEEQGLLIKLLVKDKTAMYIPDYKKRTVYKKRVEHRNTKIKNGACEMAIIVPHHMGMLLYFTEKDIGKTVFLTKEEAEKALEETIS